MRRRRDILFILPSLAGFTVFFIAPFIRSLVYAFTDNAFTRRFCGVENFRALFESEYFLLAIKNTLIFSLISVPLSMIFSIGTAVLMQKLMPKTPLIKAMFFLPVMLPSATAAAVFSGWQDRVPPFLVLILIYLWKYSGLNIMLIVAALGSLDPCIGEAAKIDGAGALRRLVSVTLPNISPVLFFMLILSIVNSLKIYRESALLFGTYPDRSVYMLQNYLSNHFEKLNYQNISAAAVIFAAALYAVVALLLRAERKRSDEI